MIKLQVGGVNYSQFDDIEVAQSLDSLSGTFRFTAFADAGSLPNFPIKVGQFCRVLVDDFTIITGFIEVINTNYDTTSHNITIQGRSKTADVIDSTLGEEMEFNAPITLKNMIELVLERGGFAPLFISVIDNVGNIEPFEASEAISAKIGMTAFSLIEGYCRKRQVLVTSNRFGNIVLTKGASSDVGFKLINDPDRPDMCNIKRASVTYNNANRFNNYIVKSQSNLGLAALFNIGNETVAAAEGESADNAIRATRQMFMLAEKASDADQCQKRATWQANVNRARAFNYEAVVQGHTNENNGRVWQSNQLVRVDDIFAALSGTYLINSVRYVQNLREGSTTTLGIITRDAYTLQASEPQKQKATSDNLADIFKIAASETP